MVSVTPSVDKLVLQQQGRGRRVLMATGSGKSLEELDKVLNSRNTARWEALLLGGGEKDDKKLFFLSRHGAVCARWSGLEVGGGSRCEARRDPDPEHGPEPHGQVLGWQDEDWQKLKKAVKYPYMKRVYKTQYQDELEIMALSDSDWAGDAATRRRTTGSVGKQGQRTLIIKGTTQRAVALSSCESKYYATCRTATLAEFLRGVAEFWSGKAKPTIMAVDSTAAKALAERQGCSRQSKING